MTFQPNFVDRWRSVIPVHQVIRLRLGPSKRTTLVGSLCPPRLDIHCVCLPMLQPCQIFCVAQTSLAFPRRIARLSLSSSRLSRKHFFPSLRIQLFTLLGSAVDLRSLLSGLRSMQTISLFIPFPSKVRTFLPGNLWKRLMRNSICTKGPLK